MTIGIRGFAECSSLCRMFFVGHSTKNALASAALGKVSLSATNAFAETRTLDKELYSAKLSLPIAKHSAMAVLGKKPSAAVYN